MPRNLAPWAALFYRAKESEMGIVITLNTQPTSQWVEASLHPSRPPGFEDYTVSIPSTPNTVMIVKPGVTLD